MKPFSFSILLFCVVLVAGFFPVQVCAESLLPKPAGAVGDFANVISPPYEKKMGAIAEELLAKAGVEVVLVTMGDLGGVKPGEYSDRLYTAWGLGNSREDRGVLILVSVRDRMMRIRPGAGLKTVLSPNRIGEIRDRFVAPLLKQNNYDDGLLNGVVALAKIVAKDSGVTLKGR